MNGTEKIYSVTLDLLRSGPAQNQLLSPLTPYIALCHNQPAEAFHVPMEHADWLDQAVNTSEVQTRAGDDATLPNVTQALLRQQRLDMTRLFGSLRSLQSEIAGGNGASMVHIRLRLNAWELAGLPFELADAPPFFPSSGQPMLLTRAPSVVITRETRRVTTNHFWWPDRPRILFAWYAPADDDVPHEAHLYALYRAIRPWCGWSTDRVSEVAHHLSILPAASLQGIERACREAVREGRPYTHVHVLAHGREMPDSPSHRRQHGLLLWNPRRAEPEVVNGERFSMALNTAFDGDLPSVVTLATCDSGNAGSAALVGGGSLAHALHDVGVSFVVASQFPLSKVGSVTMARVLYEGFLQGEDPRVTLNELRRTLRARGGAGLDWASIVAYGTIDRDLTPRMRQVSLQRLRKQCDVTLYRARAERLKETTDAHGSEQEELDKLIRQLKARTDDRAEIDGRVASLLARWVDVRLEAWTETHAPPEEHLPAAYATPSPPPPRMASLRADEHNPGVASPPIGTDRYHPTKMTVAALIRDAAELYEAVHTRRPQWLWGMVQNLHYRAALDGDLGVPKLAREELVALRHVAERELRGINAVQEREAIHSREFADRKLEALLALITVDVLELKDALDSPQFERVGERVRRMATEAVEVTTVDDFQAFSTRRVFRRLWQWLPSSYGAARQIAWDVDKDLAALGVAGLWHER